MSLQLTLNLTANTTSSRALESGAMPCDKPDGPTLAPSVPEAVRASLSPKQAREKGLTTPATSGGLCFGTSNSYALQQSLANKLLQKLDWDGGTLFKLTWKVRTTPQLRSIYALRALARPTSARDCSGWQTPTVQDGNGRDRHNQRDGTVRLSLLGEARLATWPTPRAIDFDGGGSLKQARMAIAGEKRPSGASVSRNLRDFAKLACQVSGAIPNGSDAKTGRTGQLNAAHSRWLMGLPPIWCEAAILAYRQKRQQKRDR